MSTYTTRTEAIQSEIIDAIEANGTDIAASTEYDIDAIADEVLGGYDDGFAVTVDTDEFWAAVERHALCPTREPRPHGRGSSHTPEGTRMDPAEIAARRALIGLSQQELGDALGVNRHTVKDWEAGRFTPRAGVIADLENLVAVHTAEVDRLDGAGVIIELPDGPRPRGWYVAIGARLVDRDPDVMLAWHS